MTKKIKVVWLCHFVNNNLKKRFSTPNLSEISPWINNLIEIFTDQKDIDLLIVAPNYYKNKNIMFEEKGIKYYLYKTRYLFPLKIYSKLKINQFTNYYLIKRNISRIITSINPDIIHLHGTENPIYSSGIIKFINLYKVLITIQGFISLEETVSNKLINKRKEIEQLLLRRNKYFGVRTQDTCEFIRNFNSEAMYFWHDYPITKPNVNVQNSVKLYDCVHFARLSPENGIEDLLNALAIVKKKRRDIKLLVVGYVEMSIPKLEEFCENLGIRENVEFKGFLPTQQDAFNEVVKAKIDVLPTHYDVIPGTILECLYLGIPVISYSVGGIPELNRDRPSVVLVESRNIEELAEKIELLLGDDKLRSLYSANGKKTAATYFDNDKIKNDLLNSYNELNKI